MSGRVGRNDPCPCGSGKKYKRCCLAEVASKAVPTGGVSDHAARLHDLDRGVLERILEFGMTEFEGWAPDALCPMDVTQPAAVSLFLPWSIYEHRDADGRSMAEIFRSEQAAELSPRERAWVDAQSQSRLRIWEVVATEPGRSVLVRDVLRDAERLVIERSGSERLAVHEHLLARVVDFEGISLFCGMHPRPLPPRAGDVLVRMVIEALGGKRAQRLDPAMLDEPDVGELMIEMWERIVDELARRPLPELATTDGEVLVPIEETFALAGADAAGPVRDAIMTLPHAELEDAPEGEPDDGSTRIVFIRPNPPGSQLENTILGHARITADSLVMSTLSRERAASFRKAIERGCGSLVRFVSRQEADPAELFARARAGANEERAPLRERAVPAPDAAEALRALKAHSYRDWCDRALPALGGKTPRQAVKGRSRKLRAEVDLLLREIEHRESMLHPEERFDVGPLREELGIASG